MNQDLIKKDIEQLLLTSMESLDEASRKMLLLNTSKDEKLSNKTLDVKKSIKRILNNRYDWLARKKAKNESRS